MGRMIYPKSQTFEIYPNIKNLMSRKLGINDTDYNPRNIQDLRADFERFEYSGEKFKKKKRADNGPLVSTGENFISRATIMTEYGEWCYDTLFAFDQLGIRGDQNSYGYISIPDKNLGAEKGYNVVVKLGSTINGVAHSYNTKYPYRLYTIPGRNNSSQMPVRILSSNFTRSGYEFYGLKLYFLYDEIAMSNIQLGYKYIHENGVNTNTYNDYRDRITKPGIRFKPTDMKDFNGNRLMVAELPFYIEGENYASHVRVFATQNNHVKEIQIYLAMVYDMEFGEGV